jgi:hypothetical protein
VCGQLCFVAPSNVRRRTAFAFLAPKVLFDSQKIRKYTFQVALNVPRWSSLEVRGSSASQINQCALTQVLVAMR